MIEQNEYTKITQNLDGTRTAVISTDPVQYRDETGEWQEIDKYIEETTATGTRYPALPFIVEIANDKTGYTLTHRETGEFWQVELVELGGVPLSHHPDDENVIEWFYDVSEFGVRLWKEIKKGSTLRNAKWKVTHSPNPSELHFREFVDAFNYDETMQDGSFTPYLINTDKEEIDNTSFYWLESWKKDNLLIDTDVVVDSAKGGICYYSYYGTYSFMGGFFTTCAGGWGWTYNTRPAASFVTSGLAGLTIPEAHIECVKQWGWGIESGLPYLWKDTTQTRHNKTGASEYNNRSYSSSRHISLGGALPDSGNKDCTSALQALIDDPGWGGIVTLSTEGTPASQSYAPTAKYHIIKLHVTLPAFPVNTTVNDPAMGTITPSSATLEPGMSQVFTVTANPGHSLVSLLHDGVPVALDASNTYTVDFTNNASILHAIFSPPMDASIPVDMLSVGCTLHSPDITTTLSPVVELTEPLGIGIELKQPDVVAVRNLVTGVFPFPVGVSLAGDPSIDTASNATYVGEELQAVTQQCEPTIYTVRNVIEQWQSPSVIVECAEPSVATVRNIVEVVDVLDFEITLNPCTYGFSVWADCTASADVLIVTKQPTVRITGDRFVDITDTLEISCYNHAPVITTGLCPGLMKVRYEAILPTLGIN